MALQTDKQTTRFMKMKMLDIIILAKFRYTVSLKSTKGTVGLDSNYVTFFYTDVPLRHL